MLPEGAGGDVLLIARRHLATHDGKGSSEVTPPRGLGGGSTTGPGLRLAALESHFRYDKADDGPIAL